MTRPSAFRVLGEALALLAIWLMILALCVELGLPPAGGGIGP